MDVYLFSSAVWRKRPATTSRRSPTTTTSRAPTACGSTPARLLWIETDDGAYTSTTNCMLLAATPGQVGDGGTITAGGGTQTFKGANPGEQNLRRFLVGPKEARS